jgi:hypothetical protein
MGLRREIYRGVLGAGILLFLSGVFLVFPYFMQPVYAQADESGSVQLGKPGGAGGVTSKFGSRLHPIKKVQKMHNGTDYAAGTGTRLTPNANQQGAFGCRPASSTGGYGNQAVITYGCGVQERYSHLSRCDPASRTMLSGATGNVTGPHLHYEVIIGNTFVDPEQAFNKNLCDKAVQQQLMDDAKKKGGTGGSAGTVTGSNSATPPPQTPSPSVTYVPTGGTAPNGQINNGVGYNYIVTPDGRVVIEPVVVAGENEFPVLDPSTDELVQNGQTNNPVTGCATDTWTAMVNQAVLQTRREMLWVERFIVKPDSVFAYACIDKTMRDVAKDLDVFSGTKRWVNVQIDISGKRPSTKSVTVNKELGETSLEGAINNAALIPAESFIGGSFLHDYLGGSMSGGEGGGGEEDSSQQVQENCGVMSQVWQMAKCKNADDEPLFPKFEDLIQPDSDPRKYPKNMSCKNTGITQKMIDRAKGKEVKFDKITTHLDVLMPEGNTCAPPYMTGVTVVMREGELISQEKTHKDGVCVSPGCSYQAENGGQGQCVVK